MIYKILRWFFFAPEDYFWENVRNICNEIENSPNKDEILKEIYDLK